MDNQQSTARYVFRWCNSGLIADSKTIDDLITNYQGAVDSLTMLKDAGVVLDASRSVGEDAYLVTTDQAVAERLDFEKEGKQQ